MPSRRRTTSCARGACLLAIALSGCGSPSQPENRAPPSGPRPTNPPGPSSTLDHYRSLLDIVAGSRGQPGELDQFWRTEFSNISRGSYVSPTVLGALGAGETTRCGPVVSNAAYCPADQTIAWDEAWLRDVGGIFTRDRDMGPVMIVAHEWGHHIQRLTQMPTVSIAAELQADCYAALFVSHVSEGNTRLRLEDGDVRESLTTFFLIGDREFDGSRWFEAGVHGPPDERGRASRRGYITSSIAECQAYSSYRYRERIAIGPYRLSPRPGFEEVAGPANTLELQGPGCTVQVRSVRELTAAPAADQFDTAKRTWFGSAVTEMSGASDASFVVFNRGTAVGQKYEQVVDRPGSGRTTIHGLLFLHVRPQGGGLVLDAFVDGPSRPIAEDRELERCWFSTLEGLSWN